MSDFRGGWGRTVVALYLALSAVYVALGLWRYDIFRAGVDDGIFTQVVSGTFAGFSSTQEGGANHLLVHFSPILVVALPFVALFRGATGLIVLQALAVAAIVFPVWGIAVTRLPKPFAFAVTLIAACYPPLSGVAIGDFHELAFVPALAAGMIVALDRGAWRWAIAAAIALALVKEDQFVALLFVGAVLFVFSKQPGARRCGAWIAAIAVAFAALYVFALRPSIDPHFPYWSFHYYQWWWSPPTPNGYAAWDSPMRLRYLVEAFAPLAFLPLLSRRYAIFLIPGFAEVMLSHEAITLFIGTHYSATWGGYMLCAFADGAGVLYARSATFAKAGLAVALGAAIWVNKYDSPTIPQYFLGRWIDADDRQEAAVLAALPSDASLYGDGSIFAHAGEDPNASTTLSDQEYLVFDLEGDGELYGAAATQALIAKSYALATRTNRLVVYRRRASAP